VSLVPASILQGEGYTVVEDASLTARNSFRVAARADLLIDVRTPTALRDVLAFPYLRGKPLLILGEGSNLLFTRDWNGVVLTQSTPGIQVLEDRGDGVLLRVQAGENWNDFVRWSLAKGYVGLENLALIPGTVGAAPMQNIGAYGREVREFVAAVEAFDRETNTLVHLDNSACAFGYRDSHFKRHAGRYVITAVEFLLPRTGALRMDYAGVAEELAAMGAEPTALTVAEAVSRLRTRKLPNPALIGNAGSFFKNPVIAREEAQALARDLPQLPHWPVGETQCKLSAAWLIEAQGFKGLRDGDAGVSAQHALVLVNHGSASGAQIWTLAQRLIEATKTRFGVTLEPEPQVI
jgi:UDP-N-acetylmuramate dehydrogenase